MAESVQSVVGLGRPRLPKARSVDALRLAARWGLTAASVLLAVVVYRHELAQAALPILALAFPFAAPDFQLQQFGLTQVGGEWVIRAEVMWKRITFIGGHAIYPDPRGTAQATTLAAHALLGPVVASIIALAWPTGERKTMLTELFFRITALIGALLALLLLDVPFVLSGELWQLAIDALDPGDTRAVIIWKNFMQGGGRFALAIVLALVAVGVGRFAAGRRRFKA